MVWRLRLLDLLGPTGVTAHARTSRTWCLAAGLLLVPRARSPRPTARAGAWSTCIKMVTTHDMIALRDTVWIATGEAGLRALPALLGRVRVRHPGAGRPGQQQRHRARLRPLAAACGRGPTGKGVSRLSADGSKWDLRQRVRRAALGLGDRAARRRRHDLDRDHARASRCGTASQIAGSVPDLGTPSPFRDNVITGIVVPATRCSWRRATASSSARLSQNLATWTEVDRDPRLPGRSTHSRRNGRLVRARDRPGLRVEPARTARGARRAVPGSADKLRDDFGRVLAVSPCGLYRWDGTQWNAVAAAWGSGSGAQFTEFAADPAGTLFETHAQSLLEQTGASLGHAPAARDPWTTTSRTCSTTARGCGWRRTTGA